MRKKFSPEIKWFFRHYLGCWTSSPPSRYLSIRLILTRFILLKCEWFQKVSSRKGSKNQVTLLNYPSSLKCNTLKKNICHVRGIPASRQGTSQQILWRYTHSKQTVLHFSSGNWKSSLYLPPVFTSEQHCWLVKHHPHHLRKLVTLVLAHPCAMFRVWLCCRNGAETRAVQEHCHLKVKRHAASGIIKGTLAHALMIQHFIPMRNNLEPTTSQVRILLWWAGSTMMHSSGDSRRVGDAESLVLSVLALSQSRPQSQWKPVNLERNTRQLSPKPEGGRMVSQKGWVDPLIGFGFKNWKDAINVFCLDGDPKILIEVISKRICGISDTSSQAGSARDVNMFCPHNSSSAALPSVLPISPTAKPTGTKPWPGSTLCQQVSERVPGNEFQGTEIHSWPLCQPDSVTYVCTTRWHKEDTFQTRTREPVAKTTGREW